MTDAEIDDWLANTMLKEIMARRRDAIKSGKRFKPKGGAPFKPPADPETVAMAKLYAETGKISIVADEYNLTPQTVGLRLRNAGYATNMRGRPLKA